MKRLLLTATAAALLCSCAVNPVSGHRELALITEDQEIQMGREVAAAAEAQLGLVDDARLQEYVQRVGISLAQASERPALPWTFRVVDDPTPNAFAAPGGFIFITRGLLAMMRNEAELATVLGHEIGHVTARHSVSMMSKAQLGQIGLGVGSIISPTVAQFGELAAGGLQLLFLSYSRDDERQADDLGYRYALTQGYDVREMVKVFVSLQQTSKLAGDSPIPNWLSSHPYPAERIVRIDKRIETLQVSSQLRVGEEDYLARIDGLMYGENPRNGYFESNRFFHPDMEFRFDLPPGWKAQNLAQMVVAGSPDKDALIQLTLAAGARQAAADAFLGQQGLTPGRVTRESVNGLAAVIGQFEAQTEQGPLGGRVAFITLADRTYRILAYTPAQKLSSYDSAFRQSIGSFARLTDRDALRRQPDEIEIVRLTRTMTFDQFNRAQPSIIALDQLMLINEVSDSGALLPAGFRAKRVVAR